MDQPMQVHDWPSGLVSCCYFGCHWAMQCSLPFLAVLEGWAWNNLILFFSLCVFTLRNRAGRGKGKERIWKASTRDSRTWLCYKCKAGWDLFATTQWPFLPNGSECTGVRKCFHSSAEGFRERRCSSGCCSQAFSCLFLLLQQREVLQRAWCLLTKMSIRVGKLDHTSE